jgi:hypothetical protein
VAPSILSTNANGVANFVTYNTSGTLGFTTYAGTLLSGLSGVNVGSLASITSAQSLSGVNDIYAAATTSNISGGTLRLMSVSNTNMGGLVLNGYGVAAPQISSDLLFGNLLLSQPTYGEGLVYVGAGVSSGTTTLSGAITARNFTKFGEGALRLTGNLAGLEGNFAVNSGVVSFGGANAGLLTATLSLNDLGTLDLSGGNVFLGGLAGTQGVITNLSAGTGVLTLAGTQTTTFSGVINDGSGTTKLVKKSGGNLTLTPQTAGSIMSGNNTFTGGVDLYNGSLIVQNPYGLGGYNNTTPGLVSLYGGILNLQTNAGGVNGTSIFGNPSTLGLNIAVLNATTINVDRFSGTNTGNAIQIGSLSIGNTT